MSDEQYRHAGLLLKPPEQVQDLGLDGDVEGGGRLVRDQQVRVSRQGDGDHDPLLHAPRELVWELLRASLRVGNADLVQQLDHPATGRRPLEAVMHPQTLAHLVADGEHRIQG